MSAKGNGQKKALHFHHPPERVVSLVPSLTESMFDLGLGEAMVGITDYCTQPEEKVANLPRLGGTKNPNIEEIVKLEPELVMANWEENTLPVVEALEAAGIQVWVTFPKNIRQSLDILWTLTGLFQSRLAAVRLETLELTVDWARNAASERAPVRYFCPIWFEMTSRGQPWWMTFNQDTYAHDVLALSGGENVFSDRQRRYPLDADLNLTPPQDPGERDVRYPRIALEEIEEANPEVILLPDEPFSFEGDHITYLQQTMPKVKAVKTGRVFQVDGSLITWHGTRLARALQTLPSLLI